MAETFERHIRVEVEDREFRRHKGDVREYRREGPRAAKATGAAFKRWIAGAAVAAVTALTVALGKATKEAARFEQGIQEVATLLDTDEAQLRQFRDGLQEIRNRLPVTTDLTTELYNAISAGVEADDAIEFLEVAAEAGIADRTANTAEAVDILTTAVNAFGKDASEARSVADSFFTAVRLGKTTLGELSQQIGTVAPIAASLGISLDEVNAALATLTANGLSTDRAATALRGTMNALLNNTEAFTQAGIDINEVLGERGLQGILEEVVKRTGDNTAAIREFFPDVRGLTAALSLATTAADDYDEALGAMEQKTGATRKAFKDMIGTTNALYQEFKNNLVTKLEELGEKVLPVVNDALQGAIDLLQGFDSPTKNLVRRLKELDGIDPEIIAQLETASALREARHIRNQIEEEFEEPVIINFQGTETERVRTGTIRGEPQFREQTRALFERRSLDELVQQFGGRQAALDILQSQLRNVSRLYENLAEREIEAAQAGKQLPENLVTQMEAYNEWQESLATAIARLKEYEAQTALVDELVGNFVDQTDDSTNSNENQASALEQANMALEDRIRLLQLLDAAERGIAPGQAVTARRGEEDATGALDLGPDVRSQMAEDLTSESALPLSFKAGRQLSERLKSQRDDLKKWEEELSDSSASTEEWGERLQDLGRTLRSIERLGDVFGGFSDETRRALGGTADLIDNLGRLLQLREQLSESGNLGSVGGIFQQAIPIIGAASGLVSVISSLTGSQDRTQEEIEKLRKEMVENRIAIQEQTESFKQATQQLFQEETVGSDLRFEQIEELVDSAFALSEEAGRRVNDIEAQMDRPEIESRLRAFEEAGVGEGLVDMFRTFLDRGFPIGDAINLVLERTGLTSTLLRLQSHFGDFGNSIVGIIKQMNLMQDAGSSVQDIFDAIAQDFADAGLSEALIEQIEKAFGEDRSIQDLLRSILLGRGPIALRETGLSANELEQLMQAFGGLQGAGGAGDQGFTRSQQIARTITEIQANELLAFQDEQVRLQRRIARAVETMAIAGGGGVSVDVTAGMTIEEIMIEIEEELRNNPNLYN